MDSRSGRSFFAVSPAGGFQPPRGCRICLYMCTKNLFYFVYITYFFIAFNKFLSII